MDHNESNWTIGRGTGGAVSGEANSDNVRTGEVRVGFSGGAVAHDWVGFVILF